MSESIHLTTAGAPQDVATTAIDRKRRLIRVWMVDDHASFRQGFAQLLNGTPGFKVTRQFGSTAPLLAALAEERPPDIILLDLNIGKENGLSVIAPVKGLAPTVKVVMLTTFNNTYAEAEAFRSGTSGFLLKIYDLQEIVRLIHQAFYCPSDERLFPNLAHAKHHPRLAPAKGARRIKEERPGLFTALRQLWRPRRQQAAE